MKDNTLQCPEEIDGLPVVCTWVKGWQEKMAKFIEKRQDFILLGEEEYISQIEKAYKKRDLKNLIKVILLGGSGAVAVSGITMAKITAALGFLAAADPEPISKTAFLIVLTIIFVSLGLGGVALFIKEIVKNNIEIDFGFNIKEIDIADIKIKGIVFHFKIKGKNQNSKKLEANI